MPGVARVEDRLLAVLAAGRARRDARAAEIRALHRESDEDRLVETLARQGVLALLGGRLLAVDEAPEWFAEAVARDAWLGRASAMAHEALLSRVHAALSPVGIRAVPLKGIALSHVAHGDTGIRRTSDLDVLVAPDRFEEAVGRLVALGLERGVEPLDRSGRPGLHQLLIASDMPPLELHWRIHWYEERFAGDAVARSVPDEVLGWRLAPADDLVALLLFYARDGFTGLRFPADIAAWLDRHPTLAPPDALAAAAREYPELAAALAAAARAVERAIGEDRLGRPPVRGRTRLAVRLDRSGDARPDHPDLRQRRAGQPPAHAGRPARVGGAPPPRAVARAPDQRAPRTGRGAAPGPADRPGADASAGRPALGAGTGAPRRRRTASTGAFPELESSPQWASTAVSPTVTGAFATG